MVPRQTKIVEEPLPPIITVGDTYAALQLMDSVEREEIEREAKKEELANEIAKHRWQIASRYHRLSDGKSKLLFTDRPFLEAIYQDASQDLVLLGAAQWGKTEMLLCHAFACAGLSGLRVLWVCSKMDKRNRFVSTRINPSINTVPFYKKLLSAARDRNADADSSSVKHFGAGTIFFIFASAEREFTSWDADCFIVDEHQECNQDNLAKLPSRLYGSSWGFRANAGHPDIPGSEQNQNLDWLYEQSDAREWHVPCDTCRTNHVLSWWDHVVREVKNENGAILEVRPRDESYSPGPNAMDMRPICNVCNRPMNRLSREGFWKPKHPEKTRHGYRLSSLYNVNTRIDAAFSQYVAARHKPSQMADFYNKYLGITYSLSGTRITDSMLSTCASGESSQIKPYRFMPVSQMEWAT